MIIVNFTGGAKKWFNQPELTVEKNNLSIQELLEYLIEIKPQDSISFDDKNLLVAVNGIDSSALSGFQTKLKQNDVINAAPCRPIKRPKKPAEIAPNKGRKTKITYIKNF